METLRERLIRHEGVRLKPYTCTAGRLTIGVGRNIQDKGISLDEAMMLLDHDIEMVKSQVNQEFPLLRGIDEAKRDVIYEMCFQLGINRLTLFTKMFRAIRDGDFKRAAKEMRDSAWHSQTTARCDELAKIMES